MRLARGLPAVPKNHNRIMISPADAERILTSLKHISCFDTEYVDVGRIMSSIRHVSCFEDDFEPGESKGAKRRRSSFYGNTKEGDDLAESMGCDSYSSSPISDYSDMQGDYSDMQGDYSDKQGDSTWSLEGDEEEEEEVETSSERLAVSSRSEEEVSSKKSEGSESGSSEGKYMCPVCGALHVKPSLLKQHMCAHSEDRLFVCPVENCGRQYKRQDHLNRHALTHRGNLFVCPWEGCDLAFNVNSNLQRHLKLHEQWGASLLRGCRPASACLACPKPGCGKSFKYPSMLQTHTEHVHESLSVTRAVCMEPGCGEVFDYPQLLKMHTNAAHSFAYCETCGVSMLKKNLVAHARRHEGVQEWMRCPYPGCLHSYCKKSNLDTHIRAIHMNLKPYACSHAGCEMRFAYRAVRDKHELCISHAKPVLEGDFETEDSEFKSQSRGGRKRLRLHHVDDLLPRKYRSLE